MVKKMLYLLPAAVLVNLLYSCGPKEEEKPLDMEITTDTMSADVRQQIHLIRINIPSPNDLSMKLAGAGLNFNSSMLNPASKGSSYSGTYKQALALGVYGADLGYACSYKQQQEALGFLGQIGMLAKAVNVESAFDPEFSKRLIQNVNAGKDTVMQMVDSAYAKAERNLRSNQRVATAAIMIAGGWVEGLYLAVEAAGGAKDTKKPQVKDLYHQIYKHSYSFEYVFKLLEQFPKNADCTKLMDEMKDAKPVLYEYGRKPEITPEELPKLRESITALRNKIVS
jgi:hypothetical protein